MDTWAIQAVGAGHTGNFAIGTGLAVLAFAATRVSRQLDPMHRPAVGQLAARWSRVCQRQVQWFRGLAPKRKIKPTIQVGRALAEPSGEQLPVLGGEPHAADEIFWPTKRAASSSPGGYKSKHRATGSAKQMLRLRRAPRHAAPSARSLSR